MPLPEAPRAPGVPDRACNAARHRSAARRKIAFRKRNSKSASGGQGGFRRARPVRHQVRAGRSGLDFPAALPIFRGGVALLDVDECPSRRRARRGGVSTMRYRVQFPEGNLKANSNRHWYGLKERENFAVNFGEKNREFSFSTVVVERRNTQGAGKLIIGRASLGPNR